MEQFSQSRGDDDLFDDEITPIAPSQQHLELAQQVEQLKLQQSTEATPNEHTAAQNIRGQGRGRGRGWKRGHGPVQLQQRPNATTEDTAQRNRGPQAAAPTRPPRASNSKGLAGSKFAPKPTEDEQQPQVEVQKSEEPQAQAADSVAEKNRIDIPTEASAPQPEAAELSSSSAPPNAPTGPSTTQQKPPAVRGDRTGTGGIKKPKLTDQELNERLAAAKAKSQSLAAKHAAAQADAADFEEREKVAVQKRQEEAKVRRVMEGEREKNRARKLKAVGGREWDAEKQEDDFRVPRYGDRMRRGGEDDAQDLSIYEWKEDGDRGRGSGRGRGRGRGRGGDYRGRGGRGGLTGDSNGRPSRTPDLKAVEDFPSLPGKSKLERTNSGNVGGSWADQMANE